MKRPDTTECAPFYQNYINELSEGDVLEILESQLDETLRLLQDVDEEQAEFRYAPGKWSIKEILGHLIDAERLFTYRAMCFARNDLGPLPNMDENAYVKFGKFDERTLSQLLEEYRYVRLASIAFFRGIDDEALARRGTANENQFTVRSFPFIIAGHERHHLNVLKARYLK